MKWLIVLLAVLAGVWLWKRSRQLRPPTPSARGGNPRALPMVRCARCGLHLPGPDAVTGQHGSYCSEAHRRESEGA